MKTISLENAVGDFLKLRVKSKYIYIRNELLNQNIFILKINYLCVYIYIYIIF